MATLEAKKCNSCGSVFPSTLHFCPNDGQPLAAVDSLLGTVLDGRYRIESVLGSGGMGVVYRATHIHIDSVFAIKILNPELVANQAAIERFRREAKAAGRIHHPNAIQVTDFGVTAENLVYLVMELVQGQSLRDLICDDGALDYRRTVQIMSQACAAVEAAHQSGVIHRDLKPDNILIKRVGEAEHVKVLDFGIAKLREEANVPAQRTLTQAGTIIGTPHYMSPEQCRGRHLDSRSDIYSLGVILYEMLSGQLPLDADTPLEVVVKHLNEQPRPLREVAPEVPESLERVVMRALEKNPEARQASAAELSAELQAAVEAAEGSLASPSGPDHHLAPSAPPALAPNGLATGAQASPNRSTQAPLPAGQSVPLGPAPQTVVEPLSRPTQAGAPAKSRGPVIALGAAALITVLALVGYFALRPSPQRKEEAAPKSADDMVLIPGGKFMMGRNDGEEDERPAHEVEVKAFYLDRFEVTNQQYKKFVDEFHYPPPRNWKNGSYEPDEARLPVTHVTWNDAAAYATWAKKRLPTEEEWEYAARGGDKGYLYPWGNSWADGYANVNRQDKKKTPSPVGSFEHDRSPFGVHDLAGNVSEWVENFFSKYGGQIDEKYKVYRGGNFVDDAKSSTATYRWYDLPTPPEDQLPKIGFRCAKDVEK